jgi:serine protease Do
MPMSDVAADIEHLGVYQVYTGSGTGSGFLIDARHLLTNCHVVAPHRTVAVEMRDRSRILGRVRRLHPYRDLAVVELARPADGEVLQFGNGARLKPKQDVHILGFPIGLPLSLTEGVISHAHQLLDEQVFVQTDAAINPGNSGGPILDDARRIVAVTTCKIDTADAVGFGIPVDDVREFVAEFRAQTDAFGVQCPACNVLIVTGQRYCPGCGTDLHTMHEFGDYFEAPDAHPLEAFVETALAAAGIDPVLARHGGHNWSFHSGSAPVKVWCCCSEHLNFSSPLARTPTRRLDELFAYLLSAAHAPFSFDLCGNTIRFNLVVHVSDVFTPSMHAELTARIGRFLAKADTADNLLINEFGCPPATETQMDLLGAERAHPHELAANA